MIDVRQCYIVAKLKPVSFVLSFLFAVLILFLLFRIVVDLRHGVYYQKCHDPDCKRIDYRSPGTYVYIVRFQGTSFPSQIYWLIFSPSDDMKIRWKTCPSYFHDLYRHNFPEAVCIMWILNNLMFIFYIWIGIIFSTCRL